MRINTVMVCHYNNSLIAPTSKVVNVLGQLKSPPKAPSNPPTITLGPVPYVGGHKSGSFPSMKVVCHLAAREKEEATLDLTCMVGRASPTGSWITTTVMVEVGGVLRGVPSGLLEGWLM